MVAVKILWILWKSFSTNFPSFNGTGASSWNKKDENKKNNRVRYNRLRPQVPKKTRSHPTQLNTNCGNSSCCTKRCCETHDEHFRNEHGILPSSTSIKGSTSCYDHNGNKEEPCWSGSIDNSDSEFDDGLDANRIKHQQYPTTDDESSDFDDEEDGVTCDVCDRYFASEKQLYHHQQKKRHFVCVQCDSIFASKQALEQHRDEMDHFDTFSDNCESDTTSFESDEEGLEEEERERLLSSA